MIAVLLLAGCGRPEPYAGPAANDSGVDTAIEDGDGCRASFRCPCEVGQTCSYWDGKNTEITCHIKKVVAEIVVREARPGEVP